MDSISRDSTPTFQVGGLAVINFAHTKMTLVVRSIGETTLTLVNESNQVYTAVKDERGVYVYLGRYEVTGI